MAFVDIKCLESLLIEGEELSIANEGLGSSIKGFFKVISNKFKNIINILIKLLKRFIGFLKNLKIVKKSDLEDIKNNAKKYEDLYTQEKNDKEKVIDKNNKIREEAKKYKELYNQKRIENEKNSRSSYDLQNKYDVSSERARYLTDDIIDKAFIPGNKCLGCIERAFKEIRSILINVKRKKSDYIEIINEANNVINTKFDEISNYLNDFDNGIDNIVDLSHNFYISEKQRNHLIWIISLQLNRLEGFDLDEYFDKEYLGDECSEADNKILNTAKVHFANLLKNANELINKYNRLSKIISSLQVLDEDDK